LTGAYKGKIFLVNPKLQKILGEKTYPSLDLIPEMVELVQIVVPGPLVPDILLQAAEKSVKAAIIVSSGFAETGNRQLQDKVLGIAKRYGIRVIGPNCFGLINTTLDLDLTFSFTRAIKGGVAFISQSGAMCCGTLDYAYRQDIGFSKFVNLGNKCDVDEADVLEYLIQDPQTKAIALYIEGIKNGRRFMEAAEEASQSKPLIAVKSGLTEAGARAALSHTASLASKKEIIEAAFKQAGIVKVEDIEDLIGGAVALAGQPTPKGDNVGIVTNAGGLGVTVADWCQILGLSVPAISRELRYKIEEMLPKFASSVNPVDMTGDADYNKYKLICREFLESQEIDLLISIFTSQGLVSSDGPARGIAEASRNSGKPVLALLMGGASIEQGKRILTEREIPVYYFPEKVAKAALSLTRVKNKHKRERELSVDVEF